MATPSPNEVASFMRITGAPEFVAVQKLEEYGGNLSEAINAHFLQVDTNSMHIQRQNLGAAAAASRYNYSNANVSTQNHPGSSGILPFLSAARRFRPSLLLDPNYRRELRDLYNGNGASRHPPHASPTSENMTGNLYGAHDYHNGYSLPQSDTSQHGTPDHHNDYSLPLSNTSQHVANNDVEEAMIQAAIEASKNETREGSTWNQFGDLSGSSDDGIPHRHLQQEDDDLAHALALSLKTAEEENAVREYLVKEKIKGEKTNSSRSTLELGTSSNQNVARDVAQPVIGHPLNHSSSGQLQGNEDVFISDKWGDISSDELNEALMLETALFGEIPNHSSHKVSSLPVLQHQPDKNVNPKMQCLSGPTSQLLSDTQLLRQQQDAAYLASLRADRQKELNSFKEAETHCSKEEESWEKMIERKELEKMLDLKKARLSKEPPLDDENAITIVVRMPNGSRCERRFLKTDKLQFLYDFIDIHGAVKPGTYKVVKSYPRRAYSIKDGSLTLSEVGLSSKNEALFLELI